MVHNLHTRLESLEIRADMISTLKQENRRLKEALAEMCKGQMAQDEAICAMQRRIDLLEAKKENPQCQSK